MCNAIKPIGYKSISILEHINTKTYFNTCNFEQLFIFFVTRLLIEKSIYQTVISNLTNCSTNIGLKKLETR